MGSLLGSFMLDIVFEKAYEVGRDHELLIDAEAMGHFQPGSAIRIESFHQV